MLVVGYLCSAVASLGTATAGSLMILAATWSAARLLAVGATSYGLAAA